MWTMMILMGVAAALIGAVVGSFLNVCIYRIPWEKSLVWPASHCPKCLEPIEPKDNIPILSWVLLGGKCRRCGLPISFRYPLIELLTSVMFAAAFMVYVVLPNLSRYGTVPSEDLLRFGYHAVLIALLIAASMIDVDLTLIPDQITVTGMILGLAVGAIFPEIRPGPSTALSHWSGFWVGLKGLLVGAALPLSIRTVWRLVRSREAMGLGDATLMGMIGAFLGWQAAILTFFLAAFLGLFHAAVKIAVLVAKLLTGARRRQSDDELAFGPYLSLAAVILMLCWRIVWLGAAQTYFEGFYVVFWYMLGYDP